MNEQNMPPEENLEIEIRMFCNDKKSLIIRRLNCQYVCSVERIRYHHCALFSLNQPRGGRKENSSENSVQSAVSYLIKMEKHKLVMVNIQIKLVQDNVYVYEEENRKRGEEEQNERVRKRDREREREREGEKIEKIKLASKWETLKSANRGRSCALDSSSGRSSSSSVQLARLASPPGIQSYLLILDSAWTGADGTGRHLCIASTSTGQYLADRSASTCA
ncbi:hypothetical protein T07_3892 [Trichinella nelsoni]|uniref:Uncharacterized protein n=1 Tax=Trichinella nelsoni TaxID=6336 RepID=A0A0V0RXH5_9BILA|nr:hypothetical protein T07_3892 [Trichinella nelsoni]